MTRSAPRYSGGVVAGSRRRSLVLEIALLLIPLSGSAAQAPRTDPATGGPAASVSAPDSTWLVQDSVARACLDTLSDGSLRPVTVYQVAAASDTSRVVLDQVALMSERIGERVRATLGGDSSAVPNADTLVAWRRLAGSVPVRMVVHREAATTWTTDSGADAAKAKLATLYSTVLRTIPNDALGIIWPDRLTSDSIVVSFTLTSSLSSTPPLARPGYPMVTVFRTTGVAFTPAIARRTNPVPEYPMDAMQRRIGADVMVSLVVRPNGRADAQGRTVVISSPDPIDIGTRDHFEREFSSVVEGVVRNMQFEPARVGGCVVPQQADFPFTFRRG